MVLMFDVVLALPRTKDPLVDLATSLLGQAGMYAFWSPESRFCDVIGLTVRTHSLVIFVHLCIC